MILLASAVAAPPDHETWSVERVAEYLRERTEGLVGAEPGAAQEYVLDPKDPAHFVPFPPRYPRVDQRRFTFDAEAFTQRQGASDFVSAKRRYYASLPWDPAEQAHRLPYTTPSAWTTLNHPPITTLDGPLHPWTDLFAGPPVENPAFFDADFQRALDEGGSELTHGNETLLLANDAAYREKLRMIADTRDHLYISVMFWACDASANALGDALAERVRAGVDVRLMTEGFYRETVTRRCVDRLEAAGVKIESHYDALKAPTFGSVLHWKVWIRDGEELIVGGMNIGDYENRSDGFNLWNRDTDVRVRGPAVTDAEQAWIAEWTRRGGAGGTERAAARAAERREEERAEGVRGAEHYEGWLSDPNERMRGNCRVLLQGVHARPQAIGPVLEAYVRASTRQIVFSSPTVRYDHHARANTENGHLCVHRLMRALHDQPGRRVVVLTNGVGGGMGESQMWLHARRDGALRAHQWGWYQISRQFTELVARRATIATRDVTLRLAENPGVEAWTYFAYLHTKAWLFDRTASMVGSWNLDENSADLNPEAAIICLDAPLRDALERDFALDLVNSVPDVSAGEVSSPR